MIIGGDCLKCNQRIFAFNPRMSWRKSYLGYRFVATSCTADFGAKGAVTVALMDLTKVAMIAVADFRRECFNH